MTDLADPRLSPDQAFSQYERLRSRLPVPQRQGAVRHAESLSALLDDYDLFVLDSFGVLNVGTRPISGATARVSALNAANKQVAVLTNAAAQPQRALLQKYHRLGFTFFDQDVISSRRLALAQLVRDVPEGPIAVIGDAWAIENAPLRRRAVAPNDDAAAILFLDAARWANADQNTLAQHLTNRPRPVFVANPDLVAPREDGLSLEPGHFAHDLIDRCAADVRFFGKPFGNAFAAIEARFPHIAPERIVMVGDTLQTDIIGGLARGWGTALVTGHGALKGLDIKDAINRSGIRPDWVVPAI